MGYVNIEGQENNTGNVPVVIKDASGNSPAVETAGADAGSNTNNAISVKARLVGFNGTTWDRLRTAISTATSTLTGILNTLPLLKYVSSAETLTNGQVSGFKGDANSNLLASLGALLAGEDLLTNILVTENRYSYSYCVADTQVKAGAGFVHSLTFTPLDAAATAGTIFLYDSLTEAVPTVFSYYIPAAALVPVTVILDVVCGTGIYIGFTTTADVAVTVSYR